MKLMAIFIVLFLLSINSWATPARILIVRHAEKPYHKSDDLSPKGFRRAEAMAELFERQPHLADKGLPSTLFATKYIPGNHSKRCIETLTPLAKKLNLPVETPYVREETQSLARHILTDSHYDGKTIMIAWTHSEIIELTKALNARPPVQVWNDETFDRIWMIDYSSGKTKLIDLPQSLLPGDTK
jgi:hypothetical protein